MLLLPRLGTSTCFEVMSYAFEVRLFIREKILIVEETHDQKTEKVNPKKHLAKNVSTKVFRGFDTLEKKTDPVHFSPN